VLALEPAFMAAHANLSLVMEGLGARAAAAAGLERALWLEPRHAMLWFNRGNLHSDVGSYRRALALDPAFAGAWLNLGVGLHGLGALGAAALMATRALALGAVAQALNNLANARRDQGYIAEALALYGRALAHAPFYADAERNRLAARLYVEDDEAAAAARAFVARHGGGAARLNARTDPEPERRLRVGLLSSDLGDHPVGRNLAAFVRHRDAGALFLCAYETGGRQEQASLWFRGRVDLWREVARLDDAAIAALIRADAIDVLLVLAGRFDRNRPLVASYRAAPVQVALHDGGPSGMGEGGAICAWITDRWLHPQGETSGGDRLVRLPVFYSFPKPDRLPAAWRPAADGTIRLGSFSNPAKLSPPCLAAWARVLEALPQARLVLKYRGWYGDEAVRARIAAWLPAAAAAGRVDFVAAAEDAEAHLSRYGAIDLGLDPFPFSGATTSFEALCSGVPVLSLAGRSAIARTTTAILGPLGLDELIATSVDDYVHRAVALARAPERLRELRAEIPQRLERSGLLDARAQAAALTAALRELWREWTRSQKSEGQKPEGV
jgi:predicted O-linked N-acetylglucosamine transferase (SPINDLY family)